MRYLEAIPNRFLEEFVADKHWLIDVYNAWMNRLEDEKENYVLFANRISSSNETFLIRARRSMQKLDLMNKPCGGRKRSVRTYPGNEINLSKLSTMGFSPPSSSSQREVWKDFLVEISNELCPRETNWDDTKETFPRKLFVQNIKLKSMSFRSFFTWKPFHNS